MFANLKQRREKSRQKYEQRQELIASVADLIKHDTDRIIDIAMMALETEALSAGITNLSESHYAAIVGEYSIGAPDRLASKLSDSTLRLLHQRFMSDSDGINEIVREAKEGAGPNDVFYHERLKYPVKTKESRFGTNRTYREAREALGVTDMTTIPLEKQEGVMAVLTVSAFWAERHAENRYKLGLSDYGAQMTPGLAAVIMEMPDRVDDVISYISDRWFEVEDIDKIELQNIDFMHLREVLLNSSRVLSGGVL
jgi:hypothetical protein